VVIVAMTFSQALATDVQVLRTLVLTSIRTLSEDSSGEFSDPIGRRPAAARIAVEGADQKPGRRPQPTADLTRLCCHSGQRPQQTRRMPAIARKTMK
jgi:hypothetical protein